MTNRNRNRIRFAAWSLPVLSCALSTHPVSAAEPSCATVHKAMNAALHGKPYRVRTTNLDPDSGRVKSVTTAEAQPPGRMHNFNEDGSETMVVRGQGTFNKEKGGAWAKAPFDLSDALLWAEDPKAADMTSHCKPAGNESLEGKPMSIWQYASDAFGVTSSSRMWIGDDGLPHKIETQAKIGKMRTHSEQTYEYDARISVQIPGH